MESSPGDVEMRDVEPSLSSRLDLASMYTARPSVVDGRNDVSACSGAPFPGLDPAQHLDETVETAIAVAEAKPGGAAATSAAAVLARTSRHSESIALLWSYLTPVPSTKTATRL